MTSAKSLIRKAGAILDERGATRDSPQGERSMYKTVASFNSLTGHKLTELDGWRFMLCLKLARSTGGCHHLDDFQDLIGYAALAGECAANSK